MCMQSEEILSLKMELVEMRRELGLLGKKYHNVLKRLQNQNDSCRLKEITKMNVEVFGEQL